MKVAKDLVVSLAYQVRTEDGVLVDESPVSAPLDYLHGHGSLISGLETALEGHEVGDKFDVAVGANDAYGQYDENLVQRVPKDVFRCWFPALCCFISAWRSPTLWSFRWHLASLPIPRRKGCIAPTSIYRPTVFRLLPRVRRNGRKTSAARPTRTRTAK